jgi:DNA (cytosine-5)-methyltransferase 1
MADVLTAAQRSYNMSQIRSEKTGPEVRLRDLLISRGLGDFEMQPKEIPGRPDFYFPNRKTAVFVDGCFWHGCRACFHLPKTNKDFWNTKIKSNIARDRKINKRLTALGVIVIRIREHDLKKNPERVLNQIDNKSFQGSRPKVLDLFAGAGGFSEGFIRTGCEIVGHIEMDKNACSTLITRMVYHALLRKGRIGEYKKYVLGKITRDSLIEKYGLQKERDSVICAKIGEDNYQELINQIKSRLDGQRLDIIVGGPPCQAYSYIGRARDNKNMRRDKRNFLYRYYVEFLKALRPKIFVFENVPGLESAGKGRYLEDMRRLMKRAGYTSGYTVLNAADFGVPQNRKRIILVGWSKDSNLKKYPDFPPIKREYLVGDFLAGLPKVRAGEGKHTRRLSKRHELLERLGIVNHEFGLLMEHVARSNTSQDLEIYRRAVVAKQEGKNIKYNHLPKRLKTHNNEEGFRDRFKVVDAGAKGSHTVVAHMAKDGHYYIHPDLSQNRSLTVREAARLQTFPDDYKFEGERSPQFRQIGNAVPPMLSQIIACVLVAHL